MASFMNYQVPVYIKEAATWDLLPLFF
jgi:hypothetical protein